MAPSSPVGRAERWVATRDVIDRYFESMTSGADVSSWFSDNLVLTVRGSHPLAGRHVGPANFARVMAAMGTVMTFIGVDDVLVGDGSALVMVRGVVRSGELDHQIRRYVMYRIFDEQIVAVDVLEDDQLIVDAALASVTLTGG